MEKATDSRGYWLELLAVVLMGCFLFLPWLGQVHLFDWDEINFAESAREMLVTGNWSQVQINYEPFWEKPPLYIWLSALSMKLFGISDYAARLPNALVGIATLTSVFAIGYRYYNRNVAWLWVLTYSGSILPHLYFKSGIIDPLFNLFIFLSIVALSRAYGSVRLSRYYILAGLFTGLAILTKGPVALLIVLLVVLVVWALSSFHRYSYSLSGMGAYLFSAFIVSLFWFLPEVLTNGFWFIEEFIRYQIRLAQTQDAGHGGPLYYHVIVLLLGCFPASILMLRKSHPNKNMTAQQHVFKVHMATSLAVVLILFSLVQTKILHYSSFCYFPITFLAAYKIDALASADRKLSVFQLILISVIGLTLSAAFTLLPVIFEHPELYIGKIKDDFARANLNADVDWPVRISSIGVVMITGIVYLILVQRKNLLAAVSGFLILSIIFTQLLIYYIVPRIEPYSQGAAIAWFKKYGDEEGKLIDVVGYKSYGHLYYGRRMPDAAQQLDHEFLLNNKMEQDVYFVTKNTKLERILASYSYLKAVEERNGYVLLLKPAGTGSL